MTVDRLPAGTSWVDASLAITEAVAERPHRIDGTVAETFDFRAGADVGRTSGSDGSRVNSRF